MTLAVPYLWIAGEADSLALWPVGAPVSSELAAERAATTAGYDLDRDAETVEQGGRWCVFVTPASAIRVVGETVYGADHVAPLARAAGVQTRTMPALAGRRCRAGGLDRRVPPDSRGHRARCARSDRARGAGGVIF